MIKVIEGIPPKLEKNTYVSIDLELWNADKNHLHRPHTGVFASAQFCYEPDTVHILFSEAMVQQAVDNIADCIWVFHNAKFDLTHLRRWATIKPRKQLWDTMLIEKIMYSGYYGSFGLNDLSRRYLGEYMSKDVRDTFFDGSPNSFNDEQLQYAVQDASTTLRVQREQAKKISKSDWKVWTTIELPTLWAVLDFKGMAIDVKAWETLATENKQRAALIDEQLPFNPRSSQQVVAQLRKSGFPKLPDSNEKNLVKWQVRYPDTEAARYTQQILDSRMYSKRAGTYGLKFIADYLEQDNGVDVIHTNYNTIGAETGRFSSSNPNLQNIPARDTKDFRKCFIARPGHVLVIADYGQQETRIAAYLSQDKALIELLSDKSKDIFVLIVKKVYDTDVDKSDPLRNQIKNLFYGMIYGMSAIGFATRAGITEDAAQGVMDNVFATFPDLSRWIFNQQRKIKYVQTISGRKIWLNPYSGQRERNAINAPIQGTAADMMKRALAAMHQKWAFPFPYVVVGAIHDEVVIDTPVKYAEPMAKFATYHMIEQAELICPGVPFIASAGIGENWAAK